MMFVFVFCVVLVGDVVIPGHDVSGFDISGVGYAGGTRYVTLINDFQVVGAWHWLPPVGSSVSFSGVGGVFEYDVVESVQFGRDFAVISLGGVVDSSIKRYDVLGEDVVDAVLMDDFYIKAADFSGRRGELYESWYTELDEYQFLTNQIISHHSSYRTVSGDSGSPWFFVYDGELFISGVHSYAGMPSIYYVQEDGSGVWRNRGSSIYGYLDQIDVGVRHVPEPSGLLFVICFIGLMWFKLRCGEIYKWCV